MKKSTYIKLISFGLLKKALFIYLLTQTHLFASGTYSGVYFTDYEENATLYLCNYYNYARIYDVVRNSTACGNIIDSRYEDGLYTSIQDIDDLGYVTATRLFRLKQQSHLIDWNVYTDDFGMTLHETNFIYALVGSLIGFTFLFFFILSIVGGF